MPEDGDMHIAFCGGGSGGHIAPGLAVATQVLTIAPQATFQFLTSGRDIDAKIFQASGFAERGATILALPMRGAKNYVRTVWDTLRSTVTCLSQFRKNRPDVVFGSGGFASVPGVLAAYWLGIPIALIELNAIPGRANRFLNRFATVTFTGWPLGSKFRTKWRSVIRDVGVPLRTDFRSVCDVSLDSEISQKTILVLGGSQGAAGLNRLVTNAFALDQQLQRNCHVLHQTGEANVAAVRDMYSKLSMNAEVTPFINQLSDRLQSADIVISRAGAVSLAEIAASGRPSILVPMPSSADGHQLANAKILEDAGAARIVRQNSESAANDLQTALREYVSVPASRHTAGAEARELVHLDAAQKISDWAMGMRAATRDERNGAGPAA